MSQVLSMAGVR